MSNNNFVVINGRRIPTPNQVSGNDLIAQTRPHNGRRAVMYKDMETHTIDSSKTYSKSDLLDKRGNPVKISTMPDRTKGGFFGQRSSESKNVIMEQVIDVAQNIFKNGVEVDEENMDWVIFPNYVLPEIWGSSSKTTPLMIVFPTEYPRIPPIGFYIKGDIGESPNGHVYNQAYHSAAKEPIEAGWNWYCVYVNHGSWSPKRVIRGGEWKFGDNLYTYLTLISESLSSLGD